MERRLGYLRYLGHRKWRKLKKARVPLGKSFLGYVGNRRWRRKDRKDEERAP